MGEYPTDREDLIGKQFSGGQSTELLKTILNYSGIDPSKVRYYNSVNCKVATNPTDLQINACREKVWNDIKKVQPKVIIALGNSALKSLFYKSEPGILGWRGRVIPFYEFNCWVLPTFSHVKVVQDGIPDNEKYWTKDTNYTDTLKVFREDLSIIKDLIKVPLPKIKDYKINKLLNFEDVIKLFDIAETKDFFVFDFETLGLKPYFPESCILSIALTFDGEEAFAFPISYYDFFSKKKHWSDYQEKQILNRLSHLLSKQNSHKIVHNLVFEQEWSYAILNTKIENLGDSLLQNYILDNRERTHSLAFLVFAKYGVRWKNYPDNIMSN